MAQYVKKIRTDSGDLQIDYNALANLPALNTMFSNPNLLINSDFRNPVNQRGQTTYTEGTERYGIDRWFLYNSTREVVNSGSITVTNVGAATTWFTQKFERSLDNKLPYVITVSVKSITGSGINVSIGNQDATTTRGTLTTGVNTFVVQPNEITSAMEQFVITLPVGSSIELLYAKLECGTIATPFVSRLYAEELALCQRYYEKRYVLFTPMLGEANTTYYNAINGGQHFVRKRATPTATAGSFVNHNGTDVSVTVKSYAQNADSLRSVTLNQACESYSIRAQIEFDAEIY